ncbi:SCO2322 family protein [Pseudokineococcus basanitobsidens]|uniref:SCO2322 family protein n=1 Tax=Pseudokineococcus basanitobsidens TaxID=1926649 RepID=A0ABU8RJ88_9ACTN
MRGWTGGAAALGAVVALTLADPAAAAVAPTSTAASAAPQAYAYWGSFLLRDGAWTFAPVGPSARTAEDGTVEGWRFATVGSGDRPRPPRGAPSFEEVCGEVEPVDGEVRVGVVVDYGRAVDAPPGSSDEPPGPRAACAQVPDGSSGEAVLDDVADLRAQDGVLCALDGYPVTTCQPAVDLPDAARAGDRPVDVAVGAPAPEVAAVDDAPAATGVAGPVGLAAAVAAALAVAAGLAVGGRALLRRRGDR